MHRLVKKVKLLEKAWNEGDRETVLSLYTEDVVLTCNGRTAALGKEGIAELLEMDVAAHCEIRFKKCLPVDGDTLACTLVEMNDFYRCMGLEEFRKIDIVRFRDGLICEETEACDVEQWQTMRRWMRSLFDSVHEWALRERPEIVPEIWPGGELLRTKETVTKLLALCCEWKGSLCSHETAGDLSREEG
jgi:nuclear transport factor 2 (NTF2) superfamily protein